MPSEHLLLIDLNDVRAIRVECQCPTCQSKSPITITRLNDQSWPTAAIERQCKCDWDQWDKADMETVADRFLKALLRLRGGNVRLQLELQKPRSA